MIATDPVALDGITTEFDGKCATGTLAPFGNKRYAQVAVVLAPVVIVIVAGPGIKKGLGAGWLNGSLSTPYAWKNLMLLRRSQHELTDEPV
jgi:hypothetical protein